MTIKAVITDFNGIESELGAVKLRHQFGEPKINSIIDGYMVQDLRDIEEVCFDLLYIKKKISGYRIKYTTPTRVFYSSYKEVR